MKYFLVPNIDNVTDYNDQRVSVTNFKAVNMFQYACFRTSLFPMPF